MNLITTELAARKLDVSVRRVRAMIAAGLLKGTKLGRDWVVEAKEVERLKRRHRPAGRPRRTKL